MCTVTYVPTDKGFVFTSNRDEQPIRKTITPKYYKESGVDLFFSKDAVAGGTWIGLASHKRLVCLLNGGFVYHDPRVKFPRSRGVIVTELLTTTSLEDAFKNINLQGVAPFTLILVDWSSQNKIYELVWCKEEKSLRVLDADQTYIWSSSTLYTQEMKVERKQWFEENMFAEEEFIQNKILEFHQNEDLGSKETSPKMKREVVETISTTMVVKNGALLSMNYFDYVSDEEFEFQNLFS